jgi:hypothetical protein
MSSIPPCIQRMLDNLESYDWYQEYLAHEARQKKWNADISGLYESYEALRKEKVRAVEELEAPPVPLDVRVETTLRKKTRQIESQQSLLQDLQTQLSAQESQLREVTGRLGIATGQSGQLQTQLEMTQKLLEQREIELVNLRNDLRAMEGTKDPVDIVTRTEMIPTAPIVSPVAQLASMVPRRSGNAIRLSSPPQFLSVGSDGRVITGEGSNIRILDLLRNENEQVTISLPSSVSSGSFSIDTKLVIAGTHDAGLHVMNVDSDNRTLRNLKGHSGRIKSCAFFDNSGANAKAFSAAADRTIKFWDLNRLCPIGSIPVGSQLVNAASSPDSTLVVSSHQNGDLCVWSQTQKLGQLPAHSETCLGVEFSADGRYILSCGADNLLKVYDIKMTQNGPVHSLTGFKALGTENHPTTSPDSRILSLCTAHGIQFWELESGKHLGQVAANALFHVWCQNETSKSPSLVTADETGVVRCWTHDI